MSRLDCKIWVCIYRKLCSNSVQMFFLWVLFTKEILLEAIFSGNQIPSLDANVSKLCQSGKVGKVGHQSEGPSQIQGLRRFLQQIVLFHFNSLSPTPRNTIGLKMGSSSKTGKTGSSVTGLRGRSRVCGDSCSSLINTRYYRAQRAISGFSRANR